MSKILLIEDDRVNRRLFQDCLESEGFQTISAEDGMIGIQQAKNYLPDLILCDIFMPEVNGYEVLSQLRQDPATAYIPLIFLTAMATKVERRKGMELGADDFLTKPLTAEQLLAAVSARLERQTLLERCFAAKYQITSDPPETELTVEEDERGIFPNIAELQNVFDYIEANYNREIALSDVAQAIGYSPAYLTNRVKHETGRTINAWIIERRMAAARSLLLETDWSVEQIANSVGYLNASYFFRQFRQYQGTTPKAWREEHRK
ncbi:MAG: DNA-binding response regulator [Hydrococcus sp. Prado102]|jgi:YesN/AraC family two-component response regulator|nr:DNA-binding response regulator [Hydrococcus sp. Prado102]